MESPNFNYIDDIARGDENVRKALLGVIQKEFPLEKETYNKNLETNDFKQIEDIVHRIKHKFSILGLEKSYENANKYEKSLREGKMEKELQQNFEQTLDRIEEFLSTI